MASYTWWKEISHAGLNKYKRITGNSKSDVEQKAALQMAQWEEQWKKKLEQERKRKEKEAKLKNDQERSELANMRTLEAEIEQEELESIFVKSLGNKVLPFDFFKDKSIFEKAKPAKYVLETIPEEPQRSDAIFNPKPSFGISLSKKKKEAFEKDNQERFEKAHSEWEEEKKLIDARNLSKKESYEEAICEWEKEKEDFYNDQKESNDEIDRLAEGFLNKDIYSVEKYVQLNLEYLDFPFLFNNGVIAEYRKEEKLIIADVYLPILEDLPNLKSVSYIKSRQEMKESFYPASYMNKKYDSVIYQIVMTYLNQLVKIGKENPIYESIVLNGKIKTIDKTTGHNIEPFVLSVTIGVDAFDDLNLEMVEPKSWFKKSKGVSAASIAAVTPIAPLVKMNKEDSRFVEAYSVVDQIDSGMNLATMDWQDFENLIRELFEEEYRETGGEVKITQASRDGGVDAVIFDPDPIRGGKTVIQAKRYTNVVGVSAVRDLYGTVVNEGAIKGILVTTSNYGNDAYAFAQNKPITLINGGELLYLMEKHGHKARINIEEAKLMQKE